MNKGSRYVPVGFRVLLILGIALGHIFNSSAGIAISNYGGDSIGICFDSDLHPVESIQASNYVLISTNAVVKSVATGPDPRTIILRLTGALPFGGNIQMTVGSNVFATAAPGPISLHFFSEVPSTSSATNVASLQGRSGSVGVYSCASGELRVGAISDVSASEGYSVFYDFAPLYCSEGFSITSLGEACDAGLLFLEGFAPTNRWLGMFVTRLEQSTNMVRIEVRYFDGITTGRWPGTSAITNQFQTGLRVMVARNFNRFSAVATIGTNRLASFDWFRPTPWFSQEAKRGFALGGLRGSSVPVSATLRAPLAPIDDIFQRTFYFRTNSPAPGMVIRVVPRVYADTNAVLVKSTTLIPGNALPSGISLDLDTFSFFVPFSSGPAAFFQVQSPKP